MKILTDFTEKKKGGIHYESSESIGKEYITTRDMDYYQNLIKAGEKVKFAGLKKGVKSIGFPDLPYYEFPDGKLRMINLDDLKEI
jgi:hypothetical protein